jgi:DNA polymerase V
VLESKQYQQADLFLSDSSNPILMNCLDAINHRYGQGTLALGAEGKSK